jgi:hypothetical protein
MWSSARGAARPPDSDTSGDAFAHDENSVLKVKVEITK